MDVDWERSLQIYAAGGLPEAELACAYVASRVRRDAPRRWVQGPRRPALDPGERRLRW